MRILIVTHYFLPHKGGIEIVAYNQAKELTKKGHQVTILSSKIGNEPEREKMEGTNILRIPAWNFFENKFGIPFPIFSLKIIKKLDNEIKKSDIVYIHDMSYMSSFVTSIIAKNKHKSFTVMQHIKNVETKSRLVNSIQRIVFTTTGRYIKKSSKKIIVCNEDVKTWLNENEKTTFIPNGVDINLFKPTSKREKLKLRKKYDLPKDKPIILFVGRFVEKKGYDKLFEAKNKNYLILMAGDGDIPKHMRKDKDVKIMSSMSQEKLREIYQLSDVFCLPSKNEGFPLTILEAMASGLPIITSNQPGYDKYLDKSYVKLLNPTVNNIRKAIREVLKSKKHLKIMSDYSRKTAVKSFSWNINVNKLLKIWK